MGFIGAGIGAAAGIAGAFANGAALSKVQASLEKQKKANQDWYDRRYNEDATQRADAQAILTKTEESIKQRNRQAAGSQAVMGGTDESTAAAKAANAQALAEATSNIAVNADKRKDAIEQQYQAKDAALQQQLDSLTQQKGQNIAAAAQGLGQAASGLPF